MQNANYNGGQTREGKLTKTLERRMQWQLKPFSVEPLKKPKPSLTVQRK
jgi:hypothetical protein